MRSLWIRRSPARPSRRTSASRRALLEGRSANNESMVTGESMPAAKAVGDKGIGGTLKQIDGFVMCVPREWTARYHAPPNSRHALPGRPSADSAPLGSGFRIVRLVCDSCLCRLGGLGVGAADELRTHRRRFRSHHRLPPAPLLSRLPMAASPRERERMWRSRAPASPCSMATFAASCAGGAFRDPRRGISAKNLFVAFICNAAGAPVAAGALYPAFGLLLSPAAAMALSSVSVVANSLRPRLTNSVSLEM